MDARPALALETSGLGGGVALAHAGSLAVRALPQEYRHGAAVFPAIQELLAQAGLALRDLGLLAFSQGPGSFTGLRIAATFARVLNAATGCDVVAVPTLAVIAANTWSHPREPGRIAVLIDARGGRAFGAAFERRADGYELVSGPGRYDVRPWLAGLAQPVCVLGPGVPAHRESVAAAGAEVLGAEYGQPGAEQVLALGQRLARAGHLCRPEEIVPLYLRPPECEEVYEQRRAAARQRRGG